MPNFTPLSPREGGVEDGVYMLGGLLSAAAQHATVETEPLLQLHAEVLNGRVASLCVDWIRGECFFEFVSLGIQFWIIGKGGTEIIDRQFKRKRVFSFHEVTQECPDFVSFLDALLKRLYVIERIDFRIQQMKHCQILLLMLVCWRRRQEEETLRSMSQRCRLLEVGSLPISVSPPGDAVCLVDYHYIRGALLCHSGQFVDSEYAHFTVQSTKSELIFHFAPPLPAKCWRHENPHIAFVVIDQELANDHTRLDCFAKPNLVGEKVTLNRVFQYPTDDLHLVWVKVNARRQKTGCPPRSRPLLQ